MYKEEHSRGKHTHILTFVHTPGHRGSGDFPEGGRRILCRGDRAAAAERTDLTSYPGEQMDQVGEWMLEQDVLAPSLSRDSLALLLQAECFLLATPGPGLLCLGNSTSMVLAEEPGTGMASVGGWV